MRGNFGLKLQDSRNCLSYMLHFIAMQMCRVNCEKGHCLLSLANAIVKIINSCVRPHIDNNVTWRHSSLIETVAMLVSQTNSMSIELFSYVNISFCSNKLARLAVMWKKMLCTTSLLFPFRYLVTSLKVHLSWQYSNLFTNKLARQFSLV